MGCKLAGRSRANDALTRARASALLDWWWQGRAYWTAIHPFNMEGAHVNFMMDDEVQGRIQATMATTTSVSLR